MLKITHQLFLTNFGKCLFPPRRSLRNNILIKILKPDSTIAIRVYIQYPRHATFALFLNLKKRGQCVDIILQSCPHSPELKYWFFTHVHKHCVDAFSGPLLLIHIQWKLPYIKVLQDNHTLHSYDADVTLMHIWNIDEHILLFGAEMHFHLETYGFLRRQ